MTDYNDGKWHGWNGGECPVHGQSVVEIAYRSYDGVSIGQDKNDAAAFEWGCDESPIIAFRVVEPYREPRVIWVNEYQDGSGHAYSDKSRAKANGSLNFTRVMVRYVEQPE